MLGKLHIGERNTLGSPPKKTKTETKTIKICWWLSYSIYLVNSRTISSIKEINADLSRNHRITPPSTFLDFFRKQLFAAIIAHSLCQLSQHARTQVAKKPVRVGTSPLERETLCVGYLLQFSLNSPVPFSVAHGSSCKRRAGEWERT